jgi:hypothetical protein
MQRSWDANFNRGDIQPNRCGRGAIFYCGLDLYLPVSVGEVLFFIHGSFAGYLKLQILMILAQPTHLNFRWPQSFSLT